MYFDKSNYNIEDLKGKEERAYIDGYKAAIEDLQSALDNYLEVQENDILVFSSLTEIAAAFTNFATDYLSDYIDLFLVSALGKKRESSVIQLPRWLTHAVNAPWGNVKRFALLWNEYNLIIISILCYNHTKWQRYECHMYTK